MPDATFDALIDEFLGEYFEDNPLHASGLGLWEGYADRLGAYSAAAIEERERRAAAWLGRFEQADAGALDFDQQIDRDLAIATLRETAIMRDWQMWRRQPADYLNPGLGGVFNLFLHRLRPEPELVAAAVARLRAVPGVLAEGKANLDPELTPPVYIERGIGQAGAGAAYARDLLPAEVQDPGLRQQVADAGAGAADAYDDFRAFLEDLLPRASGEWAIGERRYTRLLHEAELLGMDIHQLHQRGRQEYDRFAGLLADAAQRIAGTDDWARVLEDLQADHPPTPDAMRAAYAEWTDRARQYLIDHELVTLPEGERCEVDPSPHFQRPILAVASYSQPPALSDLRTGHFFVPYPPEGVDEAEIQQRLSSNCHAEIPTVAVHEAYPGHHYHLVAAKETPRRLRHVFGTSYFVEGWALYAEEMMREQGFFAEPAHELFSYQSGLFRAARIVVDTALHSGEMTFDEGVRFMEEKAALPAPTARAEVGRYCSWPTQAASYLTGALEIRRIRERYFEQQGARDTATLRRFHDTIARSGSLPIALAERAVVQGA